MLCDGLTVLQHRGQDAAGMVTAERTRLHLRKDNGLVKDVFQDHHMLELRGNVGLGHCRYPTAGSSSCAEAQPLYTNYPYGICVAHNGNLTNTDELTQYLSGRHVNTDSDSELLLNLFANELVTQETKDDNMVETVFNAITAVMAQCEGGYAAVYLINGFGLVACRDPHGIRPLVFGCRKSKSASGSGSTANGNGGTVSGAGVGEETFDDEGIPKTPASMDMAAKTLDYVISSESVAIDTLGFTLIRYV
jgi:amidophosphoribosyltransferase